MTPNSGMGIEQLFQLVTSMQKVSNDQTENNRIFYDNLITSLERIAESNNRLADAFDRFINIMEKGKSNGINFE